MADSPSISIDDWVAGNIIPRRDHTPSIDIALRNIRMSCRVGTLPDKGAGPTRDELGRELPDMKAFGAPDDTVGDDECWGLWPWDPSDAEQRGIPGWANAWPAETDLDLVAQDGPSNGGGGPLSTTTAPKSSFGSVSKIEIKARPVRNVEWDRDKRFVKKKISLHPSVTLLPDDFPLVVIAGTEERSQEDLGFPSGGVLVAPWHDGSAELGTWVYDATGAQGLDFDRRAHLQSAIRVYKVPKTCGPGNLFGTKDTRGLAIQMSIARGNFAGRATFADFPIVAEGKTSPGSAQWLGGASHYVGGCFHPSFGPADQHLEATNSDGDWLGPQHLDPMAKWAVSPGQDAPFLFTSLPFDAVVSPGTDLEAKLVIDNASQHPTPCGPKTGYHRWQVRVPIYVPQIKTDPTADKTFTDADGENVFTVGQPSESVYTVPPEGGFLTNTPDNPDRDQSFGSTPATENLGTNTPSNPDADQPGLGGGGGGTTGTNTPANPDADQPGFGSTPASDVGTNVPGESLHTVTYEALLVTDQPTVTDGSGPLSGIPAATPVTKAKPSPKKGKPFGIQFLTPRVVSLPSNPARLSARSRLSTSLPAIALLNELQAPSIAFRPQNLDPVAPDYRYDMGWSAADAAAWDDQTPAVATLTPIGTPSGGTWARTTPRGASRYKGGTSSGGLWVHPPEIGGEHIWDGKTPALLSSTVLGLFNVNLGLGTPLRNGKTSSGYEIALAGGGETINVLTKDNNGNTTATGQLWPLPAIPQPRLPKAYLNGLVASVGSATTPSTTVNVTAGLARDSTNQVDIYVGDPATSFVSPTGPLGNDALAGGGSGLATGTIAVSATTGSSGTFSTSILPGGLSRALTGTVDVTAAGSPSGPYSTMSAHGGSGTAFLTDLAVGDMVGNATTGYYRVMAILNDTTAYVYTDGFGGVPLSNQTFAIWEQPTIVVGGGGAVPLGYLDGTGGTTIYIALGELNGGSTGSGFSCSLGQPASQSTFTPSVGQSFVMPSWIYLWARGNASQSLGTVSWSTQRTKPYTPTSLAVYTFWRRVGVMPIGTDGFPPFFTVNDLGRARLYQYEEDPYTVGAANVPLRMLAGGGAGSWTQVNVGPAVPPTTTLAILQLTLQNPASQNVLYVRRSGFGNSTHAYRPKNSKCEAGATNADAVQVVTDGAQNVDYALFSADGVRLPAYLDVVGFYDTP